MATLHSKNNIAIELIVDGYFFVDQQEIEEYYYSCIIKHFDMPIIYVVYQNKRVEKIAFELDNSQLYNTKNSKSFKKIYLNKLKWCV